MLRCTLFGMLIGAACCAPACGAASSSGPAADEAAVPEPGRLSAEQAIERVRAALDGVAEVAAFTQRMEAAGNHLLVMLEGDADPAADTPRTWQVYVGEDHPDHIVRLWAFNVDALSGAMTITDPVTLEDVPFDLWRRQLATNPP